ncbi:hypothetical protein TIFTF001_029550 [Ficus carica]|uniref:Uncharacterized protein n=1 Tax=Ficus carica TaxID=3494 RepID=A0AA88J1N8_FICCA|nr:hypothetical protein TIFTF001_029550 [Ficus carica]
MAGGSLLRVLLCLLICFLLLFHPSFAGRGYLTANDRLSPPPPPVDGTQFSAINIHDQQQQTL